MGATDPKYFQLKKILNTHAGEHSAHCIYPDLDKGWTSYEQCGYHVHKDRWAAAVGVL